jgi:hypothetical protein
MPFGKIKLNDGNEVGRFSLSTRIPYETHSQFPLIAFGTGTAFFKKDASAQVKQAIDTGFSHIDTAASKSSRLIYPFNFSCLVIDLDNSLR